MSSYLRSNSYRSRSNPNSKSEKISNKDSKKIIQSSETTIEDFQGSIDNWEIPRVHRDQIYQTSRINFLKTNYSIKTEERDIQLTKPFETINLFSEHALQKHREKNYKYIHIGLVQVGIKPLSKEGLNTSILAILRDTRFKLFEDSLLSSIESSLCTGPISFDCYPNFTVSLNDKNILKSLVLQVKTHNYDMMEGSIPIALVFRLHYKAMTSAFSSKVKLSSKKGETLLLQTDLSRSNSVIPRSIQWKDINLPEEWILEGVTQPRPLELLEPIEPNTRLKTIEQFNDGKVKLSFIRKNNRNIDDSSCESSSSRISTIDLGRISQLDADFQRQKYQPRYSTSDVQPRFSNADIQPRFSTSDIPNPVMRNANFETQIPKPIYIPNSNFQQNEFIKSEPSSPTFSAITENVANELNVIEKDFQINKELLHKDFYSKNNSQKRFWFFQEFLENRTKIQEEFYDYLQKHKIHVFFFNWFEDYALRNKIPFPFSKTANPITIRDKTPEWETLASGKSIRANHPPQQGIRLEQSGKSIEAIPFKIPQEDDKTNIRNIILQNNFSNANLGTIGKQLDRIEKSITKNPVVPKETPSKTLKTPMFKPFQISDSSVKTCQDTNKEFIKTLQSQLSRIEVGDTSKPQTDEVPNTPTSKTQSSNVRINTLSNASETDSSKSRNFKINRLDWKNNHERQIIPAPDLGQIQPVEQSRFNSSSVYDWNLDGISEYNILNFLQKMTMAANAYRTQIGNEDKTVAELLIAGFSGQLKGWWDNYLTNQQRSEILDAVKLDEDNTPILDNFGAPQQDAVATLILSITLHFVGDPSVLRDKNAELLSNLKCKKLSDFQWYRNTFLTRVLLRQDSNQPFWKEKFLAGLPNLLGEKVRTKIRDSSGLQIIDYDDYTYGELVSIVQQEGLKICQDLKLQKHLKWELRQTKSELGSFCKQFENNPTTTSSCRGECNRRFYSKKPKFTKKFNDYKPLDNNRYRPRRKFRPRTEPKPQKPFYKDLTCFKCHKKGHTSKYCRLNRKIQELELGEEISEKISNLLLDSSSSSDYDSDNSSEKGLQDDDFHDSSSCTSNEKKNIHVLTKEQEFQIELLNSITDPVMKQKYLETLLSNMNENPKNKAENSHKEKPPKSSYDLTVILDKGKRDTPKTTLQTLKVEIKEVKQELKILKEKQQKDYEYFRSILTREHEDSSSDEQESDSLEKVPNLDEQLQTLESMPNDFLFMLREITSRKYKIKITIVFSENYKLETIALFDTGADLNCIKTDLVPKCFHHQTNEKLSAANNSKLKITSKTEASVLKDNVLFRTAFVLTEDIYQNVILGTPFINLITPYKVMDDLISFKTQEKTLTFEFVETPKRRNLNLIKACSIQKNNSINSLIHSKKFHLENLQTQFQIEKTKESLENPITKEKISKLTQLFEHELCSDLPTAFWDRKQHIVDLPYEEKFDEREIPTKARPIQMNSDLESHCRKEISELLNKKLISKSRSPWSCAAFYVNKNSEIERGTPRLVINYKPLNTALKWIRYPIPNKKDLLQKLHSSSIFSKFDLKSGFWQIQISEQDRYKTAFTVPFGQYQWNVMPFGLKNAPSEFQRIMNDIFSEYSKFCIVYIDDILIFSNSLDEHFKHLKTFYYVARKNGLVVSKTKMSLFQTKIRFLGHYISKGMVKPIERSLEFANKFPDKILDKTQLQRFLGSLNYVLDFCPNINRMAKPLHDRLKKNPTPWTEEHTALVQKIKTQVLEIPCLHIADPNLEKIVETDASDLGYGGILKQRNKNKKEEIIQYTSSHWNDAQRNYSTIKKEILSIVLCIQKFQSDLLNQKFLLRIDCKSAKDVLQKDVKNLASKQIFARWQALLSIFDFDIEYIKGDTNFIPDFLTREFLQNRYDASEAH